MGAKFTRIVDNIKAIVAKKEALGVDYPYLNFVFVAMESNLKFGNFSDFATFEDAWNSPKMQDFRKNVNACAGGGH